MIFTGFRDTDLEKKTKKKNKNDKEEEEEEEEEEAVEEAIEEEPKNPQISSFPHRAGGFELTIGATGDQVEEEEAVEDEDKEEAATELDGDDCAGGFTGFVEGFFLFFFWRRFIKGSGRLCGIKGKNKVKCPLSPNMLRR